MGWLQPAVIASGRPFIILPLRRTSFAAQPSTGYFRRKSKIVRTIIPAIDHFVMYSGRATPVRHSHRQSIDSGLIRGSSSGTDDGCCFYTSHQCPIPNKGLGQLLLRHCLRVAPTLLASCFLRSEFAL